MQRKIEQPDLVMFGKPVHTTSDTSGLRDLLLNTRANPLPVLFSTTSYSNLSGSPLRVDIRVDLSKPLHTCSRNHNFLYCRGINA